MYPLQLFFPPSIDSNQPLKIQLSNNGVPIVTTDDSHDTSKKINTKSPRTLRYYSQYLKRPNTSASSKEHGIDKFDSKIHRQYRIYQPDDIITCHNFGEEFDIESHLFHI